MCLSTNYILTKIGTQYFLLKNILIAHFISCGPFLLLYFESLQICMKLQYTALADTYPR